LFVILLGLCASALLIAGSLSISRARIFLCGLGINVFTGLQYWVMGHTSTLILVGLSFLLALTALSSLKWSALGSRKIMTAFLLAYPILFFTVGEGKIETITDVFPLLGVTCATIGSFLKNSLHIKAAFIGVGSFWLVYESSVGAYGQMVGEILTLAGNATSIVFIMLAVRKGIDPTSIPELNARISTWLRFVQKGTVNRLRHSSFGTNSRLISRSP
jgi:hypothetical protein